MTLTEPSSSSDHRAPAASLLDRWIADKGETFMTGVQAAVRIPFEQMRRDRDHGLSTAAFVSGYPGSPVAGFDLELQRLATLMAELNIVHQPGLNEELAATSVMGSQTAHRFGEMRYQGVLGIWYGKAPGLERAGDAIRHANFWGTTRHSGALAIVGDDPACKSSSVPSASEQYLADLGLPVLCPGSPQEVLDLGAHAVALSRASGLWAALKLVTAVADGSQSVDVSKGRLHFVAADQGSVGRDETSPISPATIVGVERDMREVRLELARRYVVANGLNTVSGALNRAAVGVIAPSHTMNEVIHALGRLGCQRADIEARGIRLLRLAVLHPLDVEEIRHFASGLDELIVIEEKQPFVERAVARALLGAGAPQVVGKLDESGAALVPAYGALDADALVGVLRARLGKYMDLTDASESKKRLIPVQVPPRTPYYCSGCPHNTSTQVPEGSLVGGGIGCHSIVAFLDEERFGTLTGVTQMGGEGAQWIGAAPFTRATHVFQNIGDGTFFHSGQLAIQASVAAGAHITYKILYNSTVAMTGGQDAPGSMDVPGLAKLLLDFGVAKVLVTTDEPRKYRRANLPKGVSVWDRGRILEAQQLLRGIEGVTVLIHDQRCAAQARRLRKRGKMADPPMRVAIAERVCENCGNCGYKSNCLSVGTVETEFGPKAAIDQDSCNKDYTCLEGDCPSFVTFTPRRAPAFGRFRKAANEQALTRPDPAWLDAVDLPEPAAPMVSDDYVIRITGIGGTGVVTVSQILGVAAQREGLSVVGLDQTGLSQKGGGVVSDLRFSRMPSGGSNKASEGDADLFLVLDEIVALSPQQIKAASPTRTTAIVSTTRTRTGQMIGRPELQLPARDTLRQALDEVTQAQGNRFVDAADVSREIFGDSQTSNIFLLGVACQAGLLPVSRASVEDAIRANGALVERNLLAFRGGRVWAVDPSRLKGPTTHESDVPACPPVVLRAVEALGLGSALGDLVRDRAADLSDYQSAAYALRYLAAVRRAVEAERSQSGDAGPITDIVARTLHQLMAYKDEYEVARLLLMPSVERQLRSAVPGSYRMKWNLHPPALRALGIRRKIRLGSWFRPGFRVLRSLRRIRGSVVDPFGWADMRRTERQLVQEYEALLEEMLDMLSPETSGDIAEILGLAQTISGYESIKAGSIERYRGNLVGRREKLLGVPDGGPPRRRARSAEHCAPAATSGS